MESDLSEESVKTLKVSDFKMQFVDKEDKETCLKIKNFIERHEWLGKMPTRPTHRFVATYKDKLAGVVVMATPNSFSNLLGKENKHLEKLISRGACISWSPKNLASSLIMYSIRWMVTNTEFRFFTAYSDTEARELGTIYQACNFIYLGQSSGARHEYLDPNNSTQAPFSDRLFRKTSFIKRKSIEAGIEWELEWHRGDKIFWAQIPKYQVERIKEAIRNYQASCVRREIPLKHKYVYIQGRTKAEAKRLKILFCNLNPSQIKLPYPKVRGPTEAASRFVPVPTPKDIARPCRILDQELTKRPNPCWPLAGDNQVGTKKFYSIKEISYMYGLSSWLIYSHIKTDTSFPVFNVGLKKKFLIDLKLFEAWLESKTRNFRNSQHRLLNSTELLEV